MLGIDANVLVRFLVRDDEVQFEKARRLIEHTLADMEQLFINVLVLLETEWVLRSRYRLPKGEIVDAITALLGSDDVRLEDESFVEEATFHWKDEAVNFADCLIGVRNRRMGCRATMTFDAKAARLPDFAMI